MIGGLLLFLWDMCEANLVSFVASTLAFNLAALIASDKAHFKLGGWAVRKIKPHGEGTSKLDHSCAAIY